jgi:hypothetical protein
MSTRIKVKDVSPSLSLDYLGEIRFGPAYYELLIGGVRVPARVFGENYLWTDNIGLLALQEWLSTSEATGPSTRLVVLDMRNKIEYRSNAFPGFIRPTQLSLKEISYSIVYKERGYEEQNSFQLSDLVSRSWPIPAG